MVEGWRLFFDIDVLLDILADRSPFAPDSAKVLALVERGAAVGFVAAHSITTLHYLLRRELPARRSRRLLLDMMRLLSVVPVDQDRLLQGFALGWGDFEDAVQAACAAKADVDYLVTRDRKGFGRSDIPVASPAELLAIASV